MSFRIDASLYPDEAPPHRLEERSAMIDYCARLCSAWDFGILPDAETVRELREPRWREPIDQCRLLTSPTYHLLRKWHGLPPAPFLGSVPAYIREDPNLDFV